MGDKVKRTKGWSFLHCLRSSWRRIMQIPDMVSCFRVVYGEGGGEREVVVLKG